MYVTMQRGTTTIRIVLPATFTRSATISGSFGRASFVIPRTSPAWDSDLLAEDGGQLVRLSDGTDRFVGIAKEPKWTADGAQIAVMDIQEWVGRRIPRRVRTFRACPAGLIARRAIEDAFEGSGVLPVTIGPCALGAPIIPSFEFDGRKTTQTILRDLTEQTGHEWAIDHATYAFRWQAEVGRYVDGVIVDLGDLFPEFSGQPLAQRYQQSIETDRRTKRTFTALSTTVPPLWPSQRTMEV